MYRLVSNHVSHVALPGESNRLSLLFTSRMLLNRSGHLNMPEPLNRRSDAKTVPEPFETEAKV